jgi:hypothetical protein
MRYYAIGNPPRQLLGGQILRFTHSCPALNSHYRAYLIQYILAPAQNPELSFSAKRTLLIPSSGQVSSSSWPADSGRNITRDMGVQIHLDERFAKKADDSPPATTPAAAPEELTGISKSIAEVGTRPSAIRKHMELTPRISRPAG